MIIKAYKIFVTQFGFNAIGFFVKSGLFLKLIFITPLIGVDRKAQEIIRLIIQLNTNKYLERKYKHILSEGFQKEKTFNRNVNKIWVCWLQGIHNAPEIVKKCINSQRQISGKTLTLLNKNNILDYVDINENIMQKWKKGLITNTHFSDIIRTEILVKYGGLWLDATVLVTNNVIPDYIEKSELFFYQNLKPGYNGHSLKVSSWLISAKPENPILVKTRELLNEYWKYNNKLIDYHLFHHFVSLCLKYAPSIHNKIPKYPNSIPHILQFNLNKTFDSNLYNYIKSLTPIHKLSHRDKTITML